MVTFPANYITMLIRYLIVALIGLFSVSATSQEPGAPYNPDLDGDTIIDALDVLEVIQLFGSQWLPADDDLDSLNEIQSLVLQNDSLLLLPFGGGIPLGQLVSTIIVEDSNDPIEAVAIDLDSNGEIDRMQFWECRTYCSRLDSLGHIDWRMPSFDDMTLNWDVFWPMLEITPTFNGDQYLWTSTYLSTGNVIGETIILYRDTNGSGETRFENTNTGGAGDAPGCVCARGPGS
jgi:hypothetical protein